MVGNYTDAIEKYGLSAFDHGEDTFQFVLNRLQEAGIYEKAEALWGGHGINL